MELLRACNSNDFQGDYDPALLMTYYNVEETQRLRELPKYKLFHEWCDQNGVLHPGVDYPVAFGKRGELIGMAAAKDLAPCECFLYVPQELQINRHTIKQRNPEF